MIWGLGISRSRIKTCNWLSLSLNFLGNSFGFLLAIFILLRDEISFWVFSKSQLAAPQPPTDNTTEPTSHPSHQQREQQHRVLATKKRKQQNRHCTTATNSTNKIRQQKQYPQRPKEQTTHGQQSYKQSTTTRLTSPLSY